MRLVGAAVEALHVALRRPLVTARGTVTTRHGFLLRLTSGDGVSGIGEASPAYWLGETDIDTIAGDLSRVVALVAGGTDATRLRAAAVGAAAACAVDTALLDLEARTRGTAVTTLLGGDAAAAVPVCALLAGDSVASLGDEAAAAVARGFRTLKLKVGAGATADDVARVDAARRAAGARIALRLDANGAWTPAQARGALAALEPFDIELVEEPLRAPAPHELAALAARTSIPLALDESITDAAALGLAAAAGGVSALVVKPARVGGPRRALTLARAAARLGLRVVVTDSIESAVGTRAALHVAAALAAPRLAVGLGGACQLTDVPDELTAPALRACGPGLAVAPVASTEPGAHA